MDWHDSVKGFVDIFANLDFRNGPLFYVIGIVVAGYCCLEGYRIYKAVLGGLGFIFGYKMAYGIFSHLGFSGEMLLMAETFAGLILMVLAYSIFKAGVFIGAFQFASANLPVYVGAFIKDSVPNKIILEGIIVTALSAVLAVIVARLAVKMTRPVLVCFTAVVGGFAAINFLVQLIPVFPYELELPDPASPIWLFAKIFLSAAGVGIQGVKDPVTF